MEARRGPATQAAGTPGRGFHGRLAAAARGLTGACVVHRPLTRPCIPALVVQSVATAAAVAAGQTWHTPSRHHKEHAPAGWPAEAAAGRHVLQDAAGQGRFRFRTGAAAPLPTAPSNPVPCFLVNSTPSERAAQHEGSRSRAGRGRCGRCCSPSADCQRVRATALPALPVASHVTPCKAAELS